jgi:Uncharacterized Zn-finger containing protein
MRDEEETKAMSRLLTRGAKMLQRGCDDCGNPLFRYQGEVVCPVCNERRGSEGNDAEGAPQNEAEELDTDGTAGEDASDEGGAQTRTKDVDEHLRVLAKRLARDAAEQSEDPEAVERRLDALERTLEVLGKGSGPQS